MPELKTKGQSSIFMRVASLLAAAVIAGQTLSATDLHATGETFEIVGGSGSLLKATTVAEFDEPWAMTFLPDGIMLVTTKPGKLFYVTQEGNKTEVEGIWEVAYGGQGGLGDVVLHPNFENNGLIYISNAETPDHGATFGAIVSRAKLDRSGRVPKLIDVEKIWTQEPKMPGQGHYSHKSRSGRTACYTSPPAIAKSRSPHRISTRRWARSFA